MDHTYEYYTYLSDDGNKVALITVRVKESFMKANSPTAEHFVEQIKKDTKLDVVSYGLYVENKSGDYLFSYRIL